MAAPVAGVRIRNHVSRPAILHPQRAALSIQPRTIGRQREKHLEIEKKANSGREQDKGRVTYCSRGYYMGSTRLLQLKSEGHGNIRPDMVEERLV